MNPSARFGAVAAFIAATSPLSTANSPAQESDRSGLPCWRPPSVPSRVFARAPCRSLPSPGPPPTRRRVRLHPSCSQPFIASVSRLLASTVRLPQARSATHDVLLRDKVSTDLPAFVPADDVPALEAELQPASQRPHGRVGHVHRRLPPEYQDARCQSHRPAHGRGGLRRLVPAGRIDAGPSARGAVVEGGDTGDVMVGGGPTRVTSRTGSPSASAADLRCMSRLPRPLTPRRG